MNNMGDLLIFLLKIIYLRRNHDLAWAVLNINSSNIKCHNCS